MKYLILLSVIICSCSNIKQLKKQNKNNFISRVHYSNYKIDCYKKLGNISLKEHLLILDSINWEKSFFIQKESGDFNYPDIEINNIKNGTYLSLSISHFDEHTYQYSVGLGGFDINDINKKRRIRIYGSNSNDKDLPQYLTKMFYSNNYSEILRLLKEMDFLEEINDIYNNCY